MRPFKRPLLWALAALLITPLISLGFLSDAQAANTPANWIDRSTIEIKTGNPAIDGLYKDGVIDKNLTFHRQGGPTPQCDDRIDGFSGTNPNSHPKLHIFRTTSASGNCAESTYTLDMQRATPNGHYFLIWQDQNHIQASDGRISFAKDLDPNSPTFNSFLEIGGDRCKDILRLAGGSPPTSGALTPRSSSGNDHYGEGWEEFNFGEQKDGYKGTDKDGCHYWNTANVGIGRPENAATPSSTGAGSDPSNNEDNACNQFKNFAFKWLFCPIINGMDELISDSFRDGGFINKELATSPLSDTSTGGVALKVVWSKMRDLTNIFFVLIFLIVIFANIASINIDAYTIKKALPRLVAAVILVQFSYVICSLIIDLGNILGSGIPALLTVSNIPGLEGTGSSVSNMVGGFQGLGLVVAGGAIVTALGAWLLLVPFIIGLVVSVVMVIFTLALRHFAINVLVVFSPLAFASWVLPNTEKYFKEWWENFTKIILMYPLIIMIMAIALIMRSFAGLIGLLAPIIAFMSIPATFKAASAVLSKATGGRFTGAKGYLTNKVKQGEGYKNAQLNTKSNRLGAVNRLSSMGEGKQGVLGRMQRGVGRSGARLTSIATGAPLASNSAASRQRDLNSTMKGQREQLDLMNVNDPKALSAIAAGDAQALKDLGRQDLVKFASKISSNSATRLAAMQKKGELYGLDGNDLLAIGGMTDNGALRERYRLAASSGVAYSKTNSIDPSLLTRKFDPQTGKLSHPTASDMDFAKNKVTVDNVASITGAAQIDQLYNKGMLDHVFADRVLSSASAQNKLTPEVRTKLESIRGRKGDKSLPPTDPKYNDDPVYSPHPDFAKIQATENKLDLL